MRGKKYAVLPELLSPEKRKLDTLLRDEQMGGIRENEELYPHAHRVVTGRTPCERILMFGGVCAAIVILLHM